MTNIPRIFIEPLDPLKHAERDFYYNSLESREDTVILEKTPSKSDWILLTDAISPEEFDILPNHPLIRDFPHKTLIVTESDEPIELWPGLYTSGLKIDSNEGFLDGWYYPYFRLRFPNKKLLNASETTPDEKCYLASFVGYPSHILRHKLFKLFKDHPDIHINVSKDYHHFVSENKISSETAQSRYMETMLKSHFSICPRGRGPSSIRLFESMQLGIPPVIISDKWSPPSYIDWESCAVRVKESQIGELHKILSDLKPHSEEMGKNAQRVFKEYFSQECLAKTLCRALSQLSNNIEFPKKPSFWFVMHRRLDRKLRFKTSYYKAILYNAITSVFSKSAVN